jgi:RND family efflux transporter MFP subunit
VATVADLSKLEVETDITEGLLARIAIGQAAEVSVTAVPGRRYYGRLRRVVPYGDRTKGTIKVYVEILDADEKLFPELVATVSFLPDEAAAERGSQETLLYMPRGAVVGEGVDTYAWVVDREGVVSRKPVKVTLEADRARVEEGLAAGDKVVVDPPEGLAEGVAVTTAEK